MPLAPLVSESQFFFPLFLTIQSIKAILTISAKPAIGLVISSSIEAFHDMQNKIGIRREDKNLWERRVPLIPSHVRELLQKYSLHIVIQPSSIRVFPDEDYAREKAEVNEDVSLCSIIFALKEIPLHFFEKEKVYIFFSHTIKGQSQNMPMLKKMVELGCTLIDYERIVDEHGQRLLFFGRQAGQAGMVDTLWALGQRLKYEGKKNSFSLIKQAYQYSSLAEAKEEIERIGWEIYKNGLDSAFVPFICGFTGYGHVSLGAQEIFDLLPVEVIEPEKYEAFIRNKAFSSNRLYKTVFKEVHMVEPVSPDRDFDLRDYYDNPPKYQSIFEYYLPVLSILVNCIYWAPRYPRFVTKRLLKQLWTSDSRPRLKVIGDISCDVEGSIECTLHPTSPDKPVFVYDPIEQKATDGVEGRGVVVMAIDNLPAEIPLESSVFFSTALKPLVPAVAEADFSGDFNSCHLPAAVKRAVILYRGEFTPNHEYMRSFIE